MTTFSRVQRPRRAAPDHAVRPTRAEINLSALRHNLHALRCVTGDATIWSVLKADAYGHGAPAVARTLERAGVDGIAVALLEEAIELRDAGIHSPILVMGGYYGDAEDELLAHDLSPVVYEAGHFERIARAAARVGRRANVHLKIDTGMSRLGVRPEGLAELLESARAFSAHVNVDGVMTHFASPDVAGEIGEASVHTQATLFRRCVEQICAAGHTPRRIHGANSAAILRVDAAARRVGMVGNAVRPGIALFGHLPLPQEESVAIRLVPTLRLRSEIVSLRVVPPGTPVGYGATYRTARPSVIATVPIGYADGLPRALGNVGHMLVRGVRAPIVGVLSMDLATLDVTDIAGVKLRDEAVALGEQRGVLGHDEITLAELAQRSGLIPWDVMTGISRRVPRFYREA